MQATNEKLEAGLKKFLGLVGENDLVVCESGRLQTIIKPGISLFLQHLGCQLSGSNKKLPSPEIDRVVTFSINSFDIDMNSIRIENNEWKLNKK